MSLLKRFTRYVACKMKVLYLNREDNKLYKYVICKNCNRCMRLPKNKGKLIVTCPVCGEVSEVET